MIKHFDDYDFVIIEGYKSYNYPKIITSPNVRDEYTIKEVDSFTIDEEGVRELADLIEQRGHDIVDTLFANNCGYNDGEVIAGKIRQGELDYIASFDGIFASSLTIAASILAPFNMPHLICIF